MQKFLDAAHTDKSLQIASAMHTDIKGYIYVESYKEAHVREACQGLNNLWGGKIVQVPTKEMTPTPTLTLTLTLTLALALTLTLAPA